MASIYESFLIQNFSTKAPLTLKEAGSFGLEAALGVAPGDACVFRIHYHGCSQGGGGVPTAYNI